MSATRFHVTDVNPNDTVGGGGCLCSESKVSDCKPPFVVFYVQEMESNASPHAVACQACIDAAGDALRGEILSAGEVSHPAEAEPEPELVTVPAIDGDAEEEIEL